MFLARIDGTMTSTVKHETLEGAPIEGAVILSFATYEEALAWYNSPAYIAAREQRFKGADYRAFIVQGM